MRERVLLLGAGGKTGAAYAALLQSHGHHVLWYDKNPAATPVDLDPAQLTHVPHDGLQFTTLKDKFTMLTLTPGVPMSLPFVSEARAAGVRVLSEVAYVAPLLAEFKIIGITGTDGKSTTTTFTAQILNALGYPAMECSNFGIPLSEIVLHRSLYAGKILVAEFSSYQLEEPGNLQIDVGLFLNLAPDHLNRYPSVAAYGRAKWNILGLVKQGGTAIVASALLPENTQLWKESHPIRSFHNSLISIDTQTLKGSNYLIRGESLYSADPAAALICDLRTTRIAGRHNYSNLLFALEAIRCLVGHVKTPLLAGAIQEIAPLPHRFEFIAQNVFPQMSFINDSKATTTQAAAVALQNAADPVFIFLGGQGKGERYEEFGRLLKVRNAQAFIYGECRNDMAADFRAIGFENFTLHENLFKAFHAAKRIVIQKGLDKATLLLSPAVTSWDQFSSFEERGEYFRGLVNSLE